MQSSERTWVGDSCSREEACPVLDSWAHCGVRRSISLARAYKSGSELDPRTPPIVKFYSSVFFLFPIHSFNNFFECLRCVSRCAKSWGYPWKIRQTLALVEFRTFYNLKTQRLPLSISIPTIHSFIFPVISTTPSCRLDTAIPGPISPLGRPRTNKYEREASAWTLQPWRKHTQRWKGPDLTSWNLYQALLMGWKNWNVRISRFRTKKEVEFPDLTEEAGVEFGKMTLGWDSWGFLTPWAHKVSLACSISPKCWNPHLASQTTLTGSPPPGWDTDTSSGPTESLVPSGPFRWCHPVATPGLPDLPSGAFTGHLISYPRRGSPSSRLPAKFSKSCSLAMKGLFSLAVECRGFCLFPHRAANSLSGCSSLPARPTIRRPPVLNVGLPGQKVAPNNSPGGLSWQHRHKRLSESNVPTNMLEILRYQMSILH